MRKLMFILSLFLLFISLIVIDNDYVNVYASNNEYNIISYNFEMNKIEYLYYEDSIWSSEEHVVDSFIDTSSNNDEEISTLALNPIEGSTTISPYKFVCRSVAYFDNYYGYGTSFFIGTNLLLTAAHCVIDKSGAFPNSIYVYPGKNGDSDPYGYFSVKKAYIQKEYYLNPTEKSLDYDWAILMIDSTDNTGIQPGGNFGKICNYNSNPGEETIYVYGYPNAYLNESIGEIIEYRGKRMEYSCVNTSGVSGGPVLVCWDSGWYVIGINTERSPDGSSAGGTRINYLIYFLTNSLLLENTIEIKDFYLDSSGNLIQYNCVGKIIANPALNTKIQTSNNGTSYSNTYTFFTEEYYTTSTSSTTIQFPFDYFRTYYATTNTYSSIKRLSTSFTTGELNAKYAIVARGSSGSVISTSYDQSSNKWAHGGSSSNIIKGTIVYGGEARNIEVNIPLLGTKQSNEIEINGVTFRLRCGPTYVSIKATTSINCNERTKFFAFAIA